MQPEYLELIQKAKELAKPVKHNRGCTTGYVGSALLTDKGNTYLGVSIDADCGIGFCAEHSAIAQMTTAGESKIKAIVAVSETGKVIPPCGRCRELIFQINMANNLKTEIIMPNEQILLLEDLLPNRWQEAW